MPVDPAALTRLYNPDPARVALGARRQAAVWRGERPDAWPILLNAPLTPEQAAIPDPDYRAAFFDADLMMCSQVRAACALANAGADAVPSVRGNYGTGTLLACLGLEQEVFPDKMPWLRRHLTPAEAARLGPDDIAVRGTFERGLAFMRRHRALWGGRLPLYCMDTQGPLDLAHLLLGDALFYLLHDDPPLVRHAMELCLELGIRAHRWMKEVAGEPAGVCHHGNGLFADSLGVRICEDTTALLGPGAIAEFAMPYTRRLARALGGAWAHYCGRNDALTEALCAIPEIRGINFGHVPGHEQDERFEPDMRRCLAARKVYAGAWPRRPGESGADYLRRLHPWAAQGCLIPFADAALHGPGGFASAAQARDFWYGLDAGKTA